MKSLFKKLFIAIFSLLLLVALAPYIVIMPLILPNWISYSLKPEFPEEIVRKFGKQYSISQFNKNFDNIYELHLDDDNLFFRGIVLKKDLLKDFFSDERQGLIYLCKLNLTTGEYCQKEVSNFNSERRNIENIYTDKIIVFDTNEIKLYSKTDFSLICKKDYFDYNGRTQYNIFKVWYNPNRDTYAYCISTLDQYGKLHSLYLDENFKLTSINELNGYKEITKKLRYFNQKMSVNLDGHVLGVIYFNSNERFICGVNIDKLYVLDKKAVKNKPERSDTRDERLEKYK